MEVVRHPAMDDDIVSTLGEIPRKFIRELYRLTTYMKILTDSTIISFDAWYRFILEKVYNVDMHIKHFKLDIFDLIKADEFGDRPLRIAAEKVETRLDYDFYTDEVMEVQRMIEPCKLDPQDALKYSIINTIAYVCSDLIVDYLNEYSKLTGSYEEGVRCRMIMKNKANLFIHYSNVVSKSY